MRKRSMLFGMIGVLCSLVLVMGVVYATLNTVLNINFGSSSSSAVVQKGSTWDISFLTGADNLTITKTGGNESTTDVYCNDGPNMSQPTITGTEISGINIQLTKKGDQCSYAFKVKNNGTLKAKLNAISLTKPNTACTTPSVSSMVCGNITYSLKYDSASGTALTASDTLDNGITKTIVLTAAYTGSATVSSDIAYNGFGATLNYIQN